MMTIGCFKPLLCRSLKQLIEYDQDLQYKVLFDVLGYVPTMGRTYLNTLRFDRTPGVYFEMAFGVLYMIDWADTRFKNANFIKLYAISKNISYNEALYEINKNYIFSNNHGRVDINNDIVRSRNANRDVSLDFLDDKYLNVEYCDDTLMKEYFKKLNCTNLPENLKAISKVEIMRINLKKTKFESRILKQPAMVYEWSDQKKKTYAPNETKRWKWRSSVNKNDIVFNKCENKSDTIIITKSFKDVIVLNNHGFHAIAFQSEQTLPDIELLDSILKSYKRVIILYDNDKAGKDGSVKLARHIKHHKPKIVFIDEEGCKDSADVAAKFDFWKSEKYFKELWKKAEDFMQ